MTLQELNDALAARLPTWMGGGWKDYSYVNGAGHVIMRLGTGPSAEEPGAICPESNMNEHSLTVDQLLDAFATGVAAARTVRQYRSK